MQSQQRAQQQGNQSELQVINSELSIQHNQQEFLQMQQPIVPQKMSKKQRKQQRRQEQAELQKEAKQEHTQKAQVVYVHYPKNSQHVDQPVVSEADPSQKKPNYTKPPKEQNHQRFLPDVKIPENQVLPGNILEYKLYLAREQGIFIPPDYCEQMWTLNEYPELGCQQKLCNPDGHVEKNMPLPSQHYEKIVFCPMCKEVLVFKYVENKCFTCYEFKTTVREPENDYNFCGICCFSCLTISTLGLFAILYGKSKVSEKTLTPMCPKCERRI